MAVLSAQDKSSAWHEILVSAVASLLPASKQGEISVNVVLLQINGDHRPDQEGCCSELISLITQPLRESPFKKNRSVQSGTFSLTGVIFNALQH